MDTTLSSVVVADVFEEGSGVPASLQRLGARVVVEPLSAGDYRISGGALIERKTVADLHGSLGRGRLWSQIGRIRDEAVLPFLFVEGADIDDGPCHPNAIRGCLLAVADLGVAGDPHQPLTGAQGKGRSKTAFTTLKIAVLAPMPSASVNTATAVKPGFFPSIRKP